MRSMLVYENRLIIGCKEIKIWDLNTKECLVTLEGNDEELVRSLALKDNYLIAGYDDGIIKIWDLIRKEIAWILSGHIWSVTSLLISDTTIISGSGDRLIKIWDFDSGKCLTTLVGHEEWIQSMALHKNYLFSGSSDRILKIWDLSLGICMNSIQLDDEIRQLAVDADFLYTISDFSLFHQWSLVDLISTERLVAEIPDNYYVEKSRINRIYLD